MNYLRGPIAACRLCKRLHATAHVMRELQPTPGAEPQITSSIQDSLASFPLEWPPFGCSLLLSISLINTAPIYLEDFSTASYC